MKRAVGYLCVFCVLALYVGCEWESSGENDSWDASAGWINFSGVYAASDGGVVVADFSRPTGSTQAETRWTDNEIATGVDGVHVYEGVLSKTPIVAGSLTVVGGGFQFNDTGNGTLTGNISGTSGTINYSTGTWQIDLGPLTLTTGAPLDAHYRYLEGGDGGSVIEPGNSGTPIYSFVVEQTGNKLRFIDSTGMEYNGQMGVVSQAGGDATGMTSGEVVASFEVTRPGVTISGTFQGNYAAPERDASGTAVSAGALDNRYMAATWMEDNGTTAGIVGVTAERVRTQDDDSGWL